MGRSPSSVGSREPSFALARQGDWSFGRREKLKRDLSRCDISRPMKEIVRGDGGKMGTLWVDRVRDRRFYEILVEISFVESWGEAYANALLTSSNASDKTLVYWPVRGTSPSTRLTRQGELLPNYGSWRCELARDRLLITWTGTDQALTNPNGVKLAHHFFELGRIVKEISFTAVVPYHA